MELIRWAKFIGFVKIRLYWNSLNKSYMFCYIIGYVPTILYKLIDFYKFKSIDSDFNQLIIYYFDYLINNNKYWIITITFLIIVTL